MTPKRSLTLTLIFLLAGLLVVPALAQEDKQPEPTKESIAALKETTAELRKAIAARSETDTIFFGKEVVKRFKGGDKGAKKAAVDTLAKGLKTKNDDHRDKVVELLSQTGPDAAKHLLKEAKKSKKDVGYLCSCLKAAGKVRDDKSWKDLTGYFNNKDNVVISSAVAALGPYKDSSTKIRKEIVKEILKRYNPIASAVNKPNPNSADKERYDRLYSVFESTLKQLTGQTDIEGAFQWDQWFRKDGKKLKEWK